MKSTIKRWLSKAADLAGEGMATLPVREHTYRYLFTRDLARLGIDDIFHPVGSAANYSLLYLVTRVISELPVARIVEFGAGQSTMLLDRLKGALGRPLDLTTIEHDPFWAETIARRVGHTVLNVALTRQTVADHALEFYDPAALAGLGKADLVIVDGPMGWQPQFRFNRVGVLPFLAEHLADEFVVIFDDAEREGEKLAVREFRAALARRDIAFFENHLRAEKAQHVFCSGRFRAAGYY